ncbi:MAG TPA: GntR family transcriptional regulator [Caulobacteraceae bacterium]|jgi:GntR family transcriptional regulator|nr:GntR family transcriptional regulator [Caulobacteraceae bacterium]
MHTHEQTILSTFSVERSGVPIYVQLREHFLRLIGAGALAPGERMPTMRQVAVALRVDLNTVRHAYDDLERAGAVVLRRGQGSFVAERASETDAAARARDLDVLAAQVISLAGAAGVDPLVLAERVAGLAKPKETSS